MNMGVFIKAAVGALINANHSLRYAALERFKYFFHQDSKTSVLAPKITRIKLPSPQGMEVSSSNSPALQVELPTVNLQPPAQLGMTSATIHFDCAISNLLRSGAEVSLDGMPIGPNVRSRPRRTSRMHVQINIKSMAATPGEYRLMECLNRSQQLH